MRIAEVETVPYALPFREPYVTARGRLERRELLLLRMRTDEGIEGLGEAVPLTLRGGESLARVERALRRTFRRLRRLDPMGLVGEDPLAEAIDAYVHVAAGRRLPAPARRRAGDGDLRPHREALEQPLWRLLRGERAEPVRCNATLPAGEPSAVAAAAPRLGGARVRDVQAQARAPAATSSRSGRARGGRARRAHPGRRQRRLRRRGGDRPAARAGAAGHRARGAARRSLGRWRACRGRTPIPIAADESVTSRKDAERAVEAGACRTPPRSCRRSVASAPAGAVAATLPDVPLQRARRPGRDRRGRARRAGDLPDAEDPGLAHGLATQELFAETVAVARVRASRRPAAPAGGAGPGRRARRGGAGAQPCARLAFRAWTPPTATPRSPRRLSRSLPAAACATRSSPPVALHPAGARALARAGDRNDGHRRRAQRRLLRPRRRSGDRGPGRRRSAPPARPPRTCTPPSARRTSRACRCWC